MSYVKSILLVFLSIFSVHSFSEVEKYEVMIGNERVVFYDSDCSETTLCADGYTTIGLDMFGNPRGYVYPQRKVSYEEYLSTRKLYDYEGYDQYGFGRDRKNKNGIHVKNAEILVNVFPNNK